MSPNNVPPNNVSPPFIQLYEDPQLMLKSLEIARLKICLYSYYLCTTKQR